MANDFTPGPEDLSLIKAGLVWLTGVLSVVGGWIWAVSKADSKIQSLAAGQETIKADVVRIEAKQQHYITLKDFEIRQMQCQEHIARVHAEKLHDAIMEMKDETQSLRSEVRSDSLSLRAELSIMNANLCRLLGKFEIEPARRGAHKRKEDMEQPSDGDQQTEEET